MRNKSSQQRNEQLSDVLKELLSISHYMENIMESPINGETPLDPSLIYDEAENGSKVKFSWDSVYPRMHRSSASGKLPELP